MEAHSDVFVKCDLSALLTLVRERLAGRAPQLLVEFQKKDTKKRRRLSLLDIQEVLGNFGLTFGDQEFLTIFRRYQVGHTDQFDYEQFVRNLV
jgi:Ca2+-binding EF-hand superfamily protein